MHIHVWACMVNTIFVNTDKYKASLGGCPFTVYLCGAIGPLRQEIVLSGIYMGCYFCHFRGTCKFVKFVICVVWIRSTFPNVDAKYRKASITLRSPTKKVPEVSRNRLGSHQCVCVRVCCWCPEAWVLTKWESSPFRNIYNTTIIWRTNKCTYIRHEEHHGLVKFYDSARAI